LAQGNKKGPVGRWDFDTQEEYSDYMSKKEALPKAAFQYGLKMSDGRKTRRIPGKGKNEKAELDRQWQKIQNIMEKRKPDGGGGGGGPS
jgi:IK cytokine